MPTRILKNTVFFLGFLLWVGFVPAWNHAATIEVEQDDDEVAAGPTPAAVAAPKSVAPSPAPVKEKAVTSPANKKEEKVPPPAPAMTPVPKDETRATTSESAMPRVRVSDKMGFYYLVQAGFLAKDRGQITSVGKVIGSFDEQETYSTPHKTYIEFTQKEPAVKVGDLLVISRAEQAVTEPRTSFRGYWVENLAVVKVVELEAKKCQVEVVQSFRPFQKGDLARPYEDEVQRWKQAQTKKNLPDNAIQCFVAGGEPGRETFNKMDWVFLTAGSKRGLVEGQEFKLRRRLDTSDQTVESFAGKAQVFYAGPDYSLAEILYNHIPIEKGFEAVYQP